jgi:hypothetical protein
MSSTIRGRANRRWHSGLITTTSPNVERRQKIETLKEQFDRVTKFVTSHGGWVVSVPGALDITIECAEGSDLPEKLAHLGYELREVGRRERMAPNAVLEEFVSFGKTRTRSYAGLLPVIIFSAEL